MSKPSLSISSSRYTKRHFCIHNAMVKTHSGLGNDNDNQQPKSPVIKRAPGGIQIIKPITMAMIWALLAEPMEEMRKLI